MKWWTWCEERAAGGWAVLLLVTVVLFVLVTWHVSKQTDAVLAQCQSLRP